MKTKEKIKLCVVNEGDRVTIPKYSGLFGQCDPIGDADRAGVVYVVTEVTPLEVNDAKNFSAVTLKSEASGLILPYIVTNMDVVKCE